MKKIKKRGAVYGVIALLLCAAAYLNWNYVDTPEDLLAAQHVLHNAAVCARTEAKRNTAAAQRLDRARHVDALAARFQMTGHRAIELAHLQRVLDPLRTVQCSVKRYRDNHGTPLLK